jgi:hypothetical protein
MLEEFGVTFEYFTGNRNVRADYSSLLQIHDMRIPRRKYLHNPHDIQTADESTFLMLTRQLQFMIYFNPISRIRSCIPILSNMECYMIQIIEIIVTLTEIVISVIGNMKYGTYFPLVNNYWCVFLGIANDRIWSRIQRNSLLQGF